MVWKAILEILSGSHWVLVITFCIICDISASMGISIGKESKVTVPVKCGIYYIVFWFWLSATLFTDEKYCFNYVILVKKDSFFPKSFYSCFVNFFWFLLIFHYSLHCQCIIVLWDFNFWDTFHLHFRYFKNYDCITLRLWVEWVPLSSHITYQVHGDTLKHCLPWTKSPLDFTRKNHKLNFMTEF